MKALAKQGLVNREVIGTKPVAVQYTLTKTGHRIGSLLQALQELEPDPSLRDVQL